MGRPPASGRSAPQTPTGTAAVTAAVLMAVAALLVAPAAGVAAVTLAPVGERPDVLVDQIGTAHVVWNESTPQGAADVTHYCQVPRGATACSGEQHFVPPESPAEANKDFTGPRVVQTSADQIVVLTHRYPAVVVSEEPNGRPNPSCFEERPDPGDCYGSSNNSTWAYVTDDGGATFRPPHLLGTGRLSGPPIALTAGPDAPRLGLVSDTETGGTFFQEVRPDGYTRSEANLGDGGPDRAYSGSVATFRGEQPVVAFADLTPTTYVRAHRGGPLNDPSSWRPAVAVGPGDEPRLAAGPREVHLLLRRRRATGSQYVLRGIVDATGRTSASEVAVSEVGDVVERDLHVDGGGGIHAAWVSRSGAGHTLRHRTGPDARTLTPARILASDAVGGIHGVDLGAADDGGGVAVWSSSAGAQGAVQLARFGPQTSLIDVRVTGLEVTQAIQSADLPSRDPARPTAPVPYRGALLAACCGQGGSSPRTVVRVFANSRGPLRSMRRPPTVRLRAYRGGRELGTALGSGLAPVLPEAEPRRLMPGAPRSVPMSARLDPRGAYTFTLPWRWTEAGRVTLVAEINPEGLFPGIAECVRCREDNRFTLADVPFRVTTTVPILPLELRVNGRSPAGFPDPSALFDGFRATTPLHVDVQPYQAFLDATDIANDPGLSDAERGSEALEMVEDWADDNDSDSAHYPIGVYRAGSGVRGATNGDGELYSSEQPLSVISDVRPLTLAAHEVVHGLGLKHAGRNCPETGEGEDQEGEPWAPDDMGLLDGIGLDTRGPSPYRPIASGQPDPIFDLMSYCSRGEDGRSWITLRNWNRMVEFRAPPQPAGAARAVRQAGGSATLEVVGFVDGTRSRISRVAPDSDAPLPPRPDDSYVLVARDAAGLEVARGGVDAERSQDTPSVRLVGRVPAGRTASVAFERTSEPGPVASRSRSATAPSVRLLAPVGTIGRKAQVAVRWTVSDPEGGPFDTWVEYSADAGRTWKTVAAGGSRGSVGLPRRLFQASRDARIRVRVNDGFLESSATSGRLRSTGSAPVVVIRSPRPGAPSLGGAAVPLEGAAWDDAGRRLSGRSLRWRVGRRALGTGEHLTASGLAPGRHVLSLEATDRQGRRAQRSTSIRVGSVTPMFSVLRVPSRVRRGARTIAVRLACTVPSTVSAGGRRAVCGPKVRRVVLGIRPTARSLTIVLRAGGQVSRVTRALTRM